MFRVIIISRSTCSRRGRKSAKRKVRQSEEKKIQFLMKPWSSAFLLMHCRYKKNEIAHFIQKTIRVFVFQERHKERKYFVKRIVCEWNEAIDSLLLFHEFFKFAYIFLCVFSTCLDNPTSNHCSRHEGSRWQGEFHGSHHRGLVRLRVSSEPLEYHVGISPEASRHVASSSEMNELCMKLRLCIVQDAKKVNIFFGNDQVSIPIENNKIANVIIEYHHHNFRCNCEYNRNIRY